MSKEECNNLRNQLQETLQKEVHMMRELLANMHQEELALLLNDQGSLQQILQLRSTLVDRLSSLRMTRMETTEKIEKMIGKGPSPEMLFPVEEEGSVEILQLRDQLMALTEQMNRQQMHNQHLTEHPEHIPPPSTQNAPRAKRKASIATYQIKKIT